MLGSGCNVIGPVLIWFLSLYVESRFVPTVATESDGLPGICEIDFAQARGIATVTQPFLVLTHTASRFGNGWPNRLWFDTRAAHILSALVPALPPRRPIFER
jgi:hypothetical protein